MSHAKTKPPFPAGTKAPFNSGTKAPFAGTKAPFEAAPPPPQEIQVTRYSLPALLAEIVYERAAGSYAMEKLHQAEISKIFTNNPRSRRGKAKR